MRPPPRRLFRNRPAPPAYLAGVLALSASAAPGELLEVAVLHDTDCPFPAGRGPCRCPELEVKTMAEHRHDQAERN